MEFDKEVHRKLGAGINGEVWELLGKADRSAEDDRRMIHAAHASHYHWLHAGTVTHAQRGEWLIGRVYATLGYADAALRHARRCLELTFAHEDKMEDFDRAYAHEGLTRAQAVAGDKGEATTLKARARELGNQIADPESRKFFDLDFAAGDWHGVE